MTERYADLYADLPALLPYGKDTEKSTFMLYGEDADGLNVLARLLAARLCGVSAGSAFVEHADISVYPKTDADGGKAKKSKKSDTAKTAPMNVEDVNELLDSLYLTPFELPRRVYIIQNADSMSDICQNKLLKSLEEPPRHVCFILCASGAMLPTVESRCTVIELAPFPSAVVAERLRREYPRASDRDVALAVRASRGNMGMADRLISDPEFVSVYDDALKILRLATGSRVFSAVSAVYDKFTRERTAAVLGMIEYLLGDIARSYIGAETVFAPSDVSSAAVGFTPKSAAAGAEFVREARSRVNANCMPQAVLDGLVLKIMEEKALCRR